MSQEFFELPDNPLQEPPPGFILWPDVDHPIPIPPGACLEDQLLFAGLPPLESSQAVAAIAELSNFVHWYGPSPILQLSPASNSPVVRAAYRLSRHFDLVHQAE